MPNTHGDDPANHMTGQPRDHYGRFAYTPEAVERDAKATRLYDQGATYREIAEQLGYASKGDAWRGVERARAAGRKALDEAGEDLVRAEAAHLDELYAEALEILGRDHLTVSHGTVVCSDDGRPLLDDGPKLQAINTAIKIRESYRKLRGADAEKKLNLSGGVKYEIVGVSPEDLT